MSSLLVTLITASDAPHGMTVRIGGWQSADRAFVPDRHRDAPARLALQMALRDGRERAALERELAPLVAALA